MQKLNKMNLEQESHKVHLNTKRAVVDRTEFLPKYRTELGIFMKYQSEPLFKVISWTTCYFIQKLKVLSCCKFFFLFFVSNRNACEGHFEGSMSFGWRLGKCYQTFGIR